MHPPRSKHDCSLHALGAVLLLGGLLFFFSACSPSPPSNSPFLTADTITSAVDRDSALTLLTSMQRSMFDSAYASLDRYTVSRYVRTEQLDSSGVVTAFQSSVVRYPRASQSDEGILKRRDSVGTFRSGGLLGRAAPTPNSTQRPSNVAAQVLPDQPAYVEPRTREAYRYALRADTLHTDNPIYVLEATARDRGTGRDQSVRYVRLLIDQSSRQLIGLSLVRAGRVLLFGEQSRISVRLRHAPDGTWVPHVTRVRASVSVPFRSSRQFRTVSAFYNYRR